MFKIIFVLLIISCIAPLFIEGPDGKPLMTVEQFKAKIAAVLPGDIVSDGVVPDDLVPGFAEPLLDRTPEAASVYKWQDAEGVWHFGHAPPDMSSAEQVSIGSVNSMSGNPDAHKVLNEEAAPQTAASDVIKDVAGSAMQNLPEGMLPDEMLEAAMDLQRQMQSDED